MKTIAVVISTSAMLAVAATGFAQAPATTRAERDSRYQIGMMEGVLKTAVEHGAAVMRERLRTVLPADMLLSKPVHVRGVRLDGYGVMFDVDVPSLEGALWSFQTLDQNNLGLESALSALRAHVSASGDPTLQQALQRMELAVPMPIPITNAQGSSAPAGARTGSASSTADSPATQGQAQAPDAQTDFVELYHTQIIDALAEAMLDHSRGLAIGLDDWLTVVAGGVDDEPLAGVDSDVQTAIIRIKGSDLADFLANRISHDEARQRIVVKMF
jgi:hypothetical protein